MFPCQKLVLAQVKQIGEGYKFECETAGLVADVTVEDNKPFPKGAQARFIIEMCNQRCPALQQQEQKQATETEQQ